MRKFAEGSLFLKHFSAPNTKKIGDYAFGCCYNLISVNVKSAIEIGTAAFTWCKSLKTIYLPVVQKIGFYAFSVDDTLCLDTIKLGTKFTTPTIISLESQVFGDYGDATERTDLILGEHARPEYEGNTWQRNRPAPMIYYEPYIWRSITIKKVSVEEDEKIEEKIAIYPNPAKDQVYFTISDDVVLRSIKLFDLEGKLVSEYLTSATMLDVSNINSGKYYLCFDSNRYKKYILLVIER